MMQFRARGLWYRWPIVAYDRLFRLVNGLDRPASEVGPALRLSLRRSRRRVTLADGTVIRRSDLIGVIHINNERVARIHADGLAPAATGLEFRRQFVASLEEVARLATGGALVRVRALVATTIYSYGLKRLGFQAEKGYTGSALVAAYQRALRAALHPADRLRLRAPARLRAERLWISRERLLSSFGARQTRRARRASAAAESLLQVDGEGGHHGLHRGRS